MSYTPISSILKMAPSILSAFGIKPTKQWKTFFATALSAGYGIPEITSFLRENSPAVAGERDRLQKKTAQGSAQPFEEAAATERARREAPMRALDKTAHLARNIGGAGLAGIAGQEAEEGGTLDRGDLEKRRKAYQMQQAMQSLQGNIDPSNFMG